MPKLVTFSQSKYVLSHIVIRLILRSTFDYLWPFASLFWVDDATR